MREKTAEKFENFTAQNIGKNMGIVIDQQLYSYPLISEKINNGIFAMDNIQDVEKAKNIRYLFLSGYSLCDFSLCQ